MDKEYIEEKVAGLIRGILEDTEKEITASSGLMSELDLSSLDLMVMLSDIEQEFHIVIEEEDTRQIITVGDLVECIYAKL